MRVFFLVLITFVFAGLTATVEVKAEPIWTHSLFSDEADSYLRQYVLAAIEKADHVAGSGSVADGVWHGPAHDELQHALQELRQHVQNHHERLHQLSSHPQVREALTKAFQKVQDALGKFSVHHPSPYGGQVAESNNVHSSAAVDDAVKRVEAALAHVAAALDTKSSTPAAHIEQVKQAIGHALDKAHAAVENTAAAYENHGSGHTATSVAKPKSTGAYAHPFSNDDVSKIVGDKLMLDWGEVLNRNGLELQDVVSQGTIYVDSVLEFAGMVKGAGHYAGPGTVLISGIYSPGNSPALVNVENLTLEGVLEMEIGGMIVGDEYDAIVANDTVTLGGTLFVTLIDAGGGIYQPQLGDRFEFIKAHTLLGAFQSVDFSGAPLADASWSWKLLYDYTAGTVTAKVLANPEPSSLTLLAMATATLLGSRRFWRRRRKSAG